MLQQRIRGNEALAPSSPPWIWLQHWLDVVFLHWRASPAELRPHVPEALEVQTFDGAAWVSLVLFRLHVRPRGLPFLPGFSSLLEANLRTYVEWEGEPGITFLEVLADNGWAIRAAKLVTPMPYRQAEISYPTSRNGSRFEIRPLKADVRVCENIRSRAAPFRSSSMGGAAHLPHLSVGFRLGREQSVLDGTADSWLLERYRLYLSGRRGLVQAGVVHRPWPVREASLNGFDNTIGRGMGLDLSAPPDLIHFSRGVKALFGRFRPAC